MGYNWTSPDPAPAPIKCHIPLPQGVTAQVTIALTAPASPARPPTLQEWTTIIKALATNQFTLSP